MSIPIDDLQCKVNDLLRKTGADQHEMYRKHLKHMLLDVEAKETINVPEVRKAAPAVDPDKLQLSLKVFDRPCYREDGLNTWDWADLFDISCNQNVSYTALRKGEIRYLGDSLLPSDVLYVRQAGDVEGARCALVELRDGRTAYCEEVPGDNPYFIWKVGKYHEIWEHIPMRVRLQLNLSRPQKRSSVDFSMLWLYLDPMHLAVIVSGTAVLISVLTTLMLILL